LDQGLSAAEAAGHVLTVGLALLGRGFHALETGDYAVAVALLERSLEIWRRLGLKHYASLTLRHMAQAAHGQGDVERSASYFEEVVAAFREQGIQTHVAIALHEFGTSLYEQGNFQRASQVYGESLSLLEHSDSGWSRSIRNKLG